MKLSRLTMLLLLCCGPLIVVAQNLIANPSFEEITDCPDDFFQIYKSPPWFSPNCEPLRPDRHGFAILFTGKNPCFNALTGVPKNAWSVTDAHSGSSYAGIEIVSAKVFGLMYRQYLEAPLQAAMEPGRRYFFSMYFNLSYFNNVSAQTICFKTDSLGAYLSANSIDKNPYCQALSLTPQISDDPRQIAPSTVWHEMTGCYTATGTEKFLTLGNFAVNTVSNCSPIDSIGYYLFIDDVTLIPEIHPQVDTILCRSKDFSVKAKELRKEYTSTGGWKYEWDDGSTEVERRFTTAGTYTLRVSNRNCFTDVYTFNISFAECDCKEFIPAAFTPNGDNLNDAFRPFIVCQTQQVASYRLSIFNRWGSKVFFTASLTDAWDGTYLSQPVPPGEYIYMVEYKAGDSPKFKTVKGTVMVLR